MIFLYDARYSAVLLRPKNKVKMPPQSADRKVNLYGEMGMRKFRKFISQRREDPRRPDLLKYSIVRVLLQH